MGKKSFERKKWILIFFFGMIIGASIIFFKMQFHYSAFYDKLSDLEKTYFRIGEISQLLHNEYYDQSELLSGQKNMRQQAAKAFVDGLGDPFTSYLDEEQLSGLQTELEGEGHIEGIGAVVGKKDYYLQIEEVIKNSPAFNAGLQPLDRIILIGTGETKDLTTLEAVQHIRGPQGTTVQLFIERIEKSGQKSYLHKEVQRGIIDIPSVKSKVIHKDTLKIGYIEVSIFGDQTNKLFTKAISDLLKEGVQGFILDLRGNGGGLLEVAVDLAGHFLPQGTLVTKTKYSTFNDIDYHSKGFGEIEKKPLVVLIDGLSASASEILALSLKEQLNTLLIGMQSFGKGSIQTLYKFSDETSLKYTIGKWFGPHGTTIDKTGIKPDVEIPFDFTGYLENGVDNQLQKAQDLLIEKFLQK